MENIEIRLVTPDDKSSILEFVQNRIALDGTPLLTNLQLSKPELDIVACHMVDDAFSKPDKICSFLASDKSKNRIVACALRFISEKTDPPPIPTDNLPKSDKLQSLLDFDRIIWSGVREFLPNDYDGPYLRSDLGLVHPCYRRLKLWSRMMDLGLERGYEEFRCRFSIGCFTSYKSQAHGESIGWKPMRWINYDDYYVLGKKVFNFGKDSEQKRAKLMMLDVEKWMEAKKEHLSKY